MSSAPLTETLQETLALFDGSGEPRTTVEVADLLDLGRRSTYDRLERLVEDDSLETKKVGSKARVWWRSPESFDRDTTDRTAGGRELEKRRQNERELASEQKELQERERALRRAYEVIADTDQGFQEQIEALLTVVRETLGVDYATLSHARRDQYVFEAIDSPADADISSGDSIPLETTNCERTITAERTLALRDVETDAPDLADRAGNAEWGISCYLGSPVSVDGEIYGTFCFYDMEARVEDFSDWEVAFVEFLSNWVGNELERHRDAEQLTAMNNLSEVAREITGTVIDQSTRREIEQAACDQLAASESYKFAWLAGVEPATEEIHSRVEAGLGDFLENIELSADPDEDIGQGPAGKAFRTGEMWVSQDVFTDPAFEPWRDNAEQYGFRSFAAIPVVHDQILYGVLGVYSERADAFADTEREVIGQLGEVIGHAIAAIDRKRALLSDEVVELEFRIPEFADEVGIEGDIPGTIELDEAVSVGSDNYTLYGRASTESIDSISSLVEAIPHWTDVTFREVDGGTKFELRVSEPPVLSVLAGLGGSIEQAAIEDGEYRLTVRLAPSADTRQLIDAVQEAYPSAEMVARRQSSQSDESAEKLETLLTETLTDRQRAALGAAYHAGLFEWPRDASAEDVAESLDVAAPTFHQHLRKAERKIFDALL